MSARKDFSCGHSTVLHLEAVGGNNRRAALEMVLRYARNGLASAEAEGDREAARRHDRLLKTFSACNFEVYVGLSDVDALMVCLFLNFKLTLVVGDGTQRS